MSKTTGGVVGNSTLGFIFIYVFMAYSDWYFRAQFTYWSAANMQVIEGPVSEVFAAVIMVNKNLCDVGGWGDVGGWDR